MAVFTCTPLRPALGRGSHCTSSRVYSRTTPLQPCLPCQAVVGIPGVTNEANLTTDRRAIKSQHAIVSRRQAALVAGGVLGIWTWLAEAVTAAIPARAVTLADVTPDVAPAGSLPPREQAIINIFERSTYSVVNVFDITLQGRVASTPEVDVPEGNGTGLIWDTQGHVVTNFHVLGNVLLGLEKAGRAKNAGKPERVARVTLLGNNGVQQTYDAFLVGADRVRDIAVLKIDAPQQQLQPISIGSSALLRVGQQCLAIGNPFGFDHTLTTGVISGLNRDIRSQLGGTIPGCIQTDAAINPGNSGGALLDSSGRLIGLNTAIFTNTGTSAGVGFAIPADIVARVVPSLLKYGKVVRPSLGVQVASDQVAQNLRITRGALLQSVLPNGAAAKAGLLPIRRGLTGIVPGDVILTVDGRLVQNSGDLLNVLEQYSVGDTVQLKVLRNTDQVEIPRLELL
eukprot:jgi/Chrzof1/9577/Cz04g08050.t1